MVNVAIDYLSFSVDLINQVNSLDVALEVVGAALKELVGFPIFKEIFLHNDGWEPCAGQRPYAFGRRNTHSGCFIWFGGQSTALVQFSGQGCKYLDKHNMLYGLLSAVHERLTRLDIAIDIETDTSPVEFVSAGYNNRIKSYGEQRSASGTTCYIGSRTSAKFCRVYRYAEPHPRHKLLRIEYETKKQQATIAAKSILENGIAYAADSLSKYYDWEHKENPMQNDMVEKMQSEMSNRSDAKTLHWLLKQVAPAVQRLIENGTIENPHEFFEQNFIPKKETE